jgi:putative transposase
LADNFRDRNSNRHREPFKNHRLQSHDYQKSGAYFVTICSYGRQPHFVIPELAAILKQQWQDLPRRFPSVSLDRFTIMPDHVHFIIWIKSGAAKTPSLFEILKVYKSLSAVEWLKYLKANKINEEGRIWQKGYYDRIIRDKQELEKIRLYIENNPIVARLKQNP